MKKMIMITLLTMAAVAANAAAVDWAVTGTAAQKDYTVYLLAGAPGEYASVTELANASIGNAVVKQSGRSYTTGDQQAVSDSVTKDGSYYFAIVTGSDATSFNYVEAAGLASKVYDPNNQESSPGKFNTITAAMIANGTSQSFSSVPEPTSGLLLLLGMAGLALRRKQK